MVSLNIIILQIHLNVPYFALIREDNRFGLYHRTVRCRDNKIWVMWDQRNITDAWNENTSSVNWITQTMSTIKHRVLVTKKGSIYLFIYFSITVYHVLLLGLSLSFSSQLDTLKSTIKHYQTSVRSILTTKEMFWDAYTLSWSFDYTFYSLKIKFGILMSIIKL